MRVGCEVLDRVEEEAGVIVHYLDNNGDKRVIRTSWLVGADGKRGIVRKKFLEPEGIRQEVGLYALHPQERYPCILTVTATTTCQRGLLQTSTLPFPHRQRTLIFHYGSLDTHPNRSTSCSGLLDFSMLGSFALTTVQDFFTLLI